MRWIYDEGSGIWNIEAFEGFMERTRAQYRGGGKYLAGIPKGTALNWTDQGYKYQGNYEAYLDSAQVILFEVKGYRLTEFYQFLISNKPVFDPIQPDKWRKKEAEKEAEE